MGKLFDTYKAAPASNAGEYLSKTCMECDGERYEVYFTKKRASRRTIIYCEENGTIVWEQVPLIPRLSGRPLYSGEKRCIARVSPGKDAAVVFVVRGKPRGFSGLDDGMFRSVHRFDKAFVNVMSAARFKEL